MKIKTIIITNKWIMERAKNYKYFLISRFLYYTTSSIWWLWFVNYDLWIFKRIKILTIQFQQFNYKYGKYIIILYNMVLLVPIVHTHNNII